MSKERAGETQPFCFMLLKMKTKKHISYYNSEMQYHRDNDLPAIIGLDGYKAWWMDGKRHRDNGPAIVTSDGTQYWYQNGNPIRTQYAT